jgi:hypothetical protein
MSHKIQVNEQPNALEAKKKLFQGFHGTHTHKAGHANV